MWKTISAPIEE